jgi:hypothetical protein
MYNHYVVEKAVASLECVLTSQASVGSAISGMYVSDDATVPTTARHLIEAGAVHCLQNGSTPTKTLRVEVNMAKFFNRHSIEDDSELRAPITGNPPDSCFLTVFCQDPLESTATSVAYTLTLEQTVRFMEPQDLAPSFRMERALKPVRQGDVLTGSYELVSKEDHKPLECGVGKLPCDCCGGVAHRPPQHVPKSSETGV